MPVDLHQTVTELIGHARYQAIFASREARDAGVSLAVVREADEWFRDPRYSLRSDAALRVVRFAIETSAPTQARRFHVTYQRILRHGLMPMGMTTWQRVAGLTPPAFHVPGDTHMRRARHVAARIVVLLQRALAEIYAIQEDSVSLITDARLLIHRLWSADRATDANLVLDLCAWLTSFLAWARQPAVLQHLQYATLNALSELNSPDLLRDLRHDPVEAPLPGQAAGGLAIESSLLCFGRGARFSAFASLVPGAILLVDTWNRERVRLWETELCARELWEEKLLRCIEPKQDMVKTARALTAEGLLDFYGEDVVRFRGEKRPVLVNRLYDRYRWHDATDSALDPIAVSSAELPQIVDGVTSAYLRLAQAGYVSVTPQFFVHRERLQEVRLAQLREIFPMKAFPRDYVVDSLTRAVTRRFTVAPEETPQIASRIASRVNEAIAAHTLPASLPIVSLASLSAQATFRPVR